MEDANLHQPIRVSPEGCLITDYDAAKTAEEWVSLLAEATHD
jgi:hypothetical protein